MSDLSDGMRASAWYLQVRAADGLADAARSMKSALKHGTAAGIIELMDALAEYEQASEWADMLEARADVLEST